MSLDNTTRPIFPRGPSGLERRFPSARCPPPSALFYDPISCHAMPYQAIPCHAMPPPSLRHASATTTMILLQDKKKPWRRVSSLTSSPPSQHRQAAFHQGSTAASVSASWSRAVAPHRAWWR
ncbi:unnamed protein product [Diplocarpon coronariae]